MKKILTIAGSDSSGGAGIQADLKTFSALGTYGASVITAVTAQNTLGVASAVNVSLDMIRDQMITTIDDIKPHAIKIGMLSSRDIIQVVAETLSFYKNIPIILDPVMVSKTGFYLLEQSAIESLKSVLFPLSTVVTPNILEAEALVGYSLVSLENLKKASIELKNMGCQFVLIKGGHRLNTKDAVDLFYNGKIFREYKAPMLDVKHTHGTGCTLSSAIAVFIAKGFSIEDSVGYAKEYVTQAIKDAFPVGEGVGPLNHFHHFFDKEGNILHD